MNENIANYDSSQSEGYSSQWVIWVVCGEPLVLWFMIVLVVCYNVGPVDASKTVFVNHTAVIVVTKGVYSGMGMIPKDCFGNVAIISEDQLSIEIHKVSRRA